jgi:ABC-type transport system involved in cytochrome c biogenesis permease subunit
MAAISTLALRDAAVAQLAKRENWAAQEAGVVVVFCIVFVVAVLLLALWLSKWLARRRLAKQARTGQ